MNRNHRLTHRRPVALGLVLVAALSLAAGLVLSACAGELPEPGQTLPTSSGAGVPTEESRSAQLGAQVAGTWSEAIQKLVPLLEGTPPVSTLQGPVAQLKEEYVQKMVALGRKIADLDSSEQETAYARTTDILNGTADSDWFKSYVRLYDQYAAGEDQAAQDFAVLLSTFNTLTQYAYFDVLKSQNPDEAQRLGID